MRNGWVVALVVLIIVGSIAYLLQAGGDSADAVLRPSGKYETRPEPGPSRGRAGADPGVEQPLTELEDAPRDPVPERVALAHSGVAQEQSPDSRIEGRLTLVDPDGTEHPQLEGELTLDLVARGTLEQLEVDVRAGRWSLVYPGLTEFSVSGIFIDGAPAALIEGTDIVFPADHGPFEVRAQRPTATVLHVVDDQSGAHLDEVEVILPRGFQGGTRKHPGSRRGERLASAAHSPIELLPSMDQAQQKSTHLLIHRPGYAWDSIEIDFSACGERKLRMQPEARLVVFLDGGPHRKAVLRLFASDARSVPYTEIQVKGRERIELDGMREGSYFVRLEIGEWYDNPFVQAKEEVQLLMGERAELMLEVKPIPMLERAQLGGLVIVPPEWELDQPSLRIELIGKALEGGKKREYIRWDSMQVEGDSNTRRWSAGEVQVGKYELCFTRLEYAIVIEVPSSGAPDVILEVPPPATVSVRLIDETTGLPAEIDSIHWYCTRPAGSTVRNISTVNIDPKSGRYEFQAPQCEIQLSSRGGFYPSWRETLVVGPGINEITAEALPACAIRFLLRDGETPVPWEGHEWPRPEHLDGEGRTTSLSTGDGQRTIHLSDPGRYVFELPELNGFAPIAKIEVTAIAGETVEHVVHLERK